MNCKDGHEMLKGSKFCGECGSPPAEEMHKCSNCENTLAKSAKFCAECGTSAQSEPSIELTNALEELHAFSKARIEYEAGLEEVPVIEASEVDPAPVEEIIAKASVDTGDGRKGVDALPVVAGFLSGQNLAAAQSRADADHFNKWNLHLAEGNAKLIKATLAIGRMVESMNGKVVAEGNKSRGRKVELSLISKGVTADPDAGADPEVDADPILKIGGQELIAKAQIARSIDAGCMSIEDLSRLETIGNANLTLKSVRDQVDPELYKRARRAVEIANKAAN